MAILKYVFNIEKKIVTLPLIFVRLLYLYM
jgi:hypothetical protein